MSVTTIVAPARDVMLKANVKCVPRSPLRMRKVNNSLEQRSQQSRHSISGNDKIEPIQSTTELSNFPHDIGGSIRTENTTRETSEGPDSKIAILLKGPLTNDSSEQRKLILVNNSLIAMVYRNGAYKHSHGWRGF
jgi:hypothetical protein